MNEKVCIIGRLLVGNKKYVGSIEFIEGVIRFTDYLYQEKNIEKTYAHIVIQNRNALQFNKKLGFIENDKNYKYPKEKKVNCLEQIEFVRDRKEYLKARKRIVNIFNAKRIEMLKGEE